MTYTNRKTTPLKWHNFVKFLLLPVMSLGMISSFIGLVNELFGLRLPYCTYVLTPIVEGFGATISNLGDCFWYVVGYFVLYLFVTILMCYACIGFFRWKNSSRRAFLFGLLLTFLVTATFCVSGFMLYRSAPGQFNTIVAKYFSANGIQNDALLSSPRVVLGSTMATTIIAFLYFILNFVYYKKRKKLFVDTYLQDNTYAAKPVVSQPVEEATPVVNQVPPTTVEESTPATPVEEPTPVVPVEEPTQETNVVEPEVIGTPEEKVVPTMDQEPIQDAEIVEPVKQEEVAVETPKVMKYCPECGAELTDADQSFCTHCGKKIR